MRVAILGPLEVHDDEGGVVPLAGARLRALVARLALAGGQPVSTGALAEAVWDCAPPADVPNALQTLVSRARRALGGSAAVEQSAAGYRLAVGPGDVDALRFERLVVEGTAAEAAADGAAAEVVLAEALALWRGPALADAGDFAVPFARRLEELRLEATVTLRTREFEQGTVRVGELEALVARSPLDEKLTGLLMRALAAEGRQADALAAYEALRARLGDELGIDPGPDLQAVHLAVLRGEIRRPVTRRDEPAAPPAVIAPRVATNLRAPLTSFVGRADEVKRVRQALENYRLVTLVGPGGAGKTRLAAEAAAQLRDTVAGPGFGGIGPDGTGLNGLDGIEVGGSWPEEIWIVELASVTDAADVPQAVLGAVGPRETHLLSNSALSDGAGAQRSLSRDARTRLLDGLTDIRALLILDNCEHLIDACAHLADELLAHAPQLRIVATSREPLGITGESLFVVPPLREEPAVRLFADRAAAVSPGFEIDGATRLLAVDIVTRLDGLPLAIELAAARLRTLPLAEISARLADRFRLLTGGSRTALPRHRTLRAVVEWSWDLLTSEERLLAERFSVFPAGATPAAVAAVCATVRADDLDERDVDELLSSLVDKSLLQPLADGTRLRMLETIREYGAEQLAGRGEVGGLRRRHAGYYSELMYEAAPKLRTRDQLRWLPEVRDDRDNILTALRYWCDAGDADSALHLAVSLSIMALLLGNDADMAELTGEALAVPGEADPSLRTIAEAVHLVTSTMDPATVGPATVISPGLAERIDALDITKYPIAALLRPVYAVFSKDEEHLRRYLDEAHTVQDEWLSAAAWLMAAGLAENGGNLEGTRSAAAEALGRFRALGERWGLSMALRNIANLQMLDGDLDGAVETFTEARQLLAELGHHEDLSQVQLKLAEVAARRGDLAKARELSAAAMQAAEVTGSPIERGITAAWWAAFEARWGDIDVARSHQAAAERQLAQFAPTHPAREHMEAMVAATNVRIALADEDLISARDQAFRSYRSAVAADDMPLFAQAAGTIAELALALGEPARAAELLGACAALRGGDDPTDPITAQLAPSLRAALGDAAYERAYATGKALTRTEAVERLDPALL